MSTDRNVAAMEFITAQAKVWAQQVDAEPDEASRLCALAARAFLASPSPSDSQGGVSGWPKWTKCDHATGSFVVVEESEGDFGTEWLIGSVNPPTRRLFLNTCAGRVGITHAEAIRLVPAIAEKYPLAQDKGEYTTFADIEINRLRAELREAKLQRDSWQRVASDERACRLSELRPKPSKLDIEKRAAEWAEKIITDENLTRGPDEPLNCVPLESYEVPHARTAIKKWLVAFAATLESPQ